MTEEEAKTFEMLLVTLGKCVAERRALITIARDGGIRDLEARLETHRASKEYQLILRKFEVAAKQSRVDQTAEALAQLMQQLNEGKPPN
jgi:hypothetical protein